MKHRYFINGVVLLIIIKMISVSVFAHKNRYQALVLVTANDSQIETLQPDLFRKLFLAVPVVLNNQKLIPLINTSDDLLYEVFLQKVVYMSERYYERMLISKTFRTGRLRPARYSNNTKLVKALKSIPGSISFMWSTTAEKEKYIRIVQVIWEERH